MTYSHIQRINMFREVKFYIKFEGKKIFYFDLDVTLTFICDLDLINDLWPHTKD